jgi:EmrB/QacA subfamily drug resistance transporter
LVVASIRCTIQQVSCIMQLVLGERAWSTRVPEHLPRDLPEHLEEHDVAPVAEPDPRRWWTLAILITTVVLIGVDTSVLNVSIPTILRELDTTVPSLQWVITGYSLTFASLLIIGGRLGDIYGHRRLFVVGAALFGVGSLIASEARSVGVLIFGEAVVEGIGAALMAPATLAILSTTFKGRERATAFAAWGATAGAAVAFGPVLGGFLTTNYSWRWSFRINVVVAPLAVIGALLVMPKGERRRRTPIDLPGAALVASGMFLLVFALSEGGAYGWLSPTDPVTVAGRDVWPSTWAISVVPVALLAGLALLGTFVLVERSKERRATNPLFEFSLLRFRTFRYGLLTLGILAMGQLGLLFALPLFLQDAVHLTAQENGLWLLPLGLFVIVGSQIGARLTRVFNTTAVVRLGLLIESGALVLLVWSITPDITFLRILPGLALFGVGLGFASSQLTNLILSEIPSDTSGVASGATSTARQLGAALGAAVIGSLLTVQTTNRAIAALSASPALPASVKAQAAAGFDALGPNFTPPASLDPADAEVLRHVLTQSLAEATRLALVFAAGVVFAGALLSFLIPLVRPPRRTGASEVIETFEPLDPLEVDRGLLDAQT